VLGGGFIAHTVPMRDARDKTRSAQPLAASRA
jgi:hypothetical protein